MKTKWSVLSESLFTSTLAAYSNPSQASQAPLGGNSIEIPPWKKGSHRRVLGMCVAPLCAVPLLKLGTFLTKWGLAWLCAVPLPVWLICWVQARLGVWHRRFQGHKDSHATVGATCYPVGTSFVSTVCCIGLHRQLLKLPPVAFWLMVWKYSERTEHPWLFFLGSYGPDEEKWGKDQTTFFLTFCWQSGWQVSSF